jgi:acyl-CoA synthetase (AMP-forming)/AMP-acid ligase II
VRIVDSFNEKGLEQAIVYAVPSGDVQAGELCRAVIRSLREHLAPFKQPAQVEMPDALLLASTGKVARFTLRGAVELL